MASTSDYIDDLATAIAALSKMLDDACTVIGDEAWKEVYAVVPWTENIDLTAASKLRDLAKKFEPEKDELPNCVWKGADTPFAKNH